MILYFSGTGNSLSAARLLARETGDTAVHVIDLTTHCGTCRGIQDKVIGFVFPVYFGDLPDPVREFVEYTRFAPSTYFYAVATCGGTAGQCLVQPEGNSGTEALPSFLWAGRADDCQ